MIRRSLILVVLILTALFSRGGPALANMLQDRVKTVVAVEFFTETELDRRSTNTFGVVIDDNGTIVFSSQAVGARVSPKQLEDFRIYFPGEPTTQQYSATYLGRDEFTGWEYIRVDEEAARERLVPITAYDQAPEPIITDEIWGVGLKKKAEDFKPYFMSSRVSVLQSLPQRTAIAMSEVSGLGLPSYDQAGRFVGLSIGGFGRSFLQYSSRILGGVPVVMVNPDESAVVMLAHEILPYLDRIPTNIEGRPTVWMGTNGLQPLDPEVARYLELENQAGLVVSEILQGSPAEKMGLLARDVILSLDGEPLPVLKPDHVVITYFQREMRRRNPGDKIVLGILRGNERQQIEVVLEDAPLTPREAERRYFDSLGMTIRGFTFIDGVQRRLDVEDHHGVIAHFVKANAPASTAGLLPDDLIDEIDGVKVASYDDAELILESIAQDVERGEFVLLVKRAGDTAVLRVKLK
jgi:serine protease Do